MTETQPDFEFVIIGAGVAGLYQLLRLRDLSTRVTVFEANDDVGGTWYKNRYPGCRFDSESFTYAYSFSEELLEEWTWSERFASQPETLAYLNHVADKFDLRKDIQFGCRVTGAAFDEANHLWEVRLDDGRGVTTRFLLTAIGVLSAPTPPRIVGMDSFAGVSVHTFDWPTDGVDLTGKRVAVIGTGSTGVQVISTIASEVSQLTVFQRRPNWCAPLHNGPIGAREMAEIKRSYAEIFRQCAESPSGFMHKPLPVKTLEVAREERLALWEELYNSPGFGIWLGNYKDTLMDEAANAELSQFVADKIRRRVKDPAVADKLIPRDHGFGARRVPLETGYYEVYNRPNVQLVDVSETPIEEVLPTGIRTSDATYDVDVIIYATGFDAVTGAFDRIDFVGVDGVHLKDRWDSSVSTFLGVQVSGFPNLFTIVGPQSGSAATNFPRGIESIVGWMTDFAAYLLENGYTWVEPKPDAEERWVSHVADFAARTLMGRADSWFTGRNTNVDRADSPRLLIYTGGAVHYRRFLTEQAELGYPDFILQTVRDQSAVTA